MKFPETMYSRSVAPTDYNILNFHLLKPTQNPVDAFKISGVTMFGAGISRWRYYQHFYSARFLAY